MDDGHDQSVWGGAGAQSAGAAKPGGAGPGGFAPGAPASYGDARAAHGGDRHGPRRTGAHRDRDALTIGAVLVTVGAVLLAYRFSDTLAAGSAPLVIGLGFIAWWAMSGNFGLVVPGGVLAGIGLGMVIQQAGFYGEAVPLGLGLGFLAIYLLDALRRREWSRWWPLVPAVVLVAVGLFSNTTAWGRLGEFGWPLILILVGVAVLAVGLSRRRSGR